MIKCRGDLEKETANFLKYLGTYNDCLLLEYIPNAITFLPLIGSAPIYYQELVSQSIRAKDLIHRDIHPDQLLWDEQRVLLIDFETAELNKSTRRFSEDRGDLAVIPDDVQWEVDGGEYQSLKKSIQLAINLRK